MVILIKLMPENIPKLIEILTEKLGCFRLTYTTMNGLDIYTDHDGTGFQGQWLYIKDNKVSFINSLLEVHND